MRFVVVTGTSTGVGKTIATAALARAGLVAGLRVGVVKPVQTGTTSDEPSDAAVIAHLSGCSTVTELVTLPDPLAPDTAARLRQVEILPVATLAEQIVELASDLELVLVEGAGGIAVRLDTAGGTLADLASLMSKAGHHVELVVVTSTGLGTLNHTELTVQLLQQRGLRVAGLVLGNVPAEPGLAERCNLTELPRVTGLPVIGAIPQRVGSWSPTRFQASCVSWVSGFAATLDQRSTESGSPASRDVTMGAASRPPELPFSTITANAMSPR